MASAIRGCWMLSKGMPARAAARSGVMPSVMAASSFRSLRHCGRVAMVMGDSLRSAIRCATAPRVVAAGFGATHPLPPTLGFAIRLAALVNLGPSDASDAVLPGWTAGRRTGVGESLAAGSLRLRWRDVLPQHAGEGCRDP